MSVLQSTHHPPTPPPNTKTKGAGIELHSLTLEGALLLTVPEGTTVVIKDASVKNKGHKIVPVPADEADEVWVIGVYG